jgi:hypothetical protein
MRRSCQSALIMHSRAAAARAAVLQATHEAHKHIGHAAGSLIDLGEEVAGTSHVAGSSHETFLPKCPDHALQTRRGPGGGTTGYT